MLDFDAPMDENQDAPTSEPADAKAEQPSEQVSRPRRRRAASRPAGPPAALEPAPAQQAIAAPLTRLALENTEPADVEAEVVPEPEPAKPTRTPRKRASRPAGPPAPIVEPEPSAEPEPALEAEPVSELDAVAAADPEDAAPVAVEPEASDTPTEGSVDAPAAEPLPDLEVAEAPKPKRSRRRKQPVETPVEPTSELQADDEAAAASTEAPAADGSGTDGDEVAASLAALEASRPRRRSSRRRTAEPVAEPADEVAAALNNLVASIAGDESDESAPADDVEPIEASDDEATPASAGEGAEPTSAPDTEQESDGEDNDEESSGGRRRRRRRGGRRRRRSADREDESDESEDSDEDSGDESDDQEDTETEAPTSGTSRRRRRRRRRGEDPGDEATEEGVDVVVKVREPRKAKSASDEITGIEGSTRMEAKRQRRREGRAAGRRRAPILSEAEFLARRESVERKMVIRQREQYTQIGVLEDGVLVEHYVDRDSSASMIGNIYLGRVQNVLPSMEAAFVDIGRGRNAVLYAGEVDWDSFGVSGPDRKVEKVLKSGQAVLVQVTKDPVGQKGARLTSHISIPGRYVVYSPGGQLSGISRKLPENERARLKGILDDLVGENASVIVRTAAEGASEDELVRDVNRLKAQWEVIEKKVAQGNSPQLLYSEPDLTVRIVRDLFTEDFSELIIDGNGEGEDAYDTVQGYVTHVAPHLQERLTKWNRWTQGDLFAEYRVDEQVSKALERKVHLPSGGSLVIDRTEAMTVIDVNTGKFTGTQGNLEATVTSNNLEAAEEVVRQLRLRDIGGIIVIDFIDMVLPANRELLLRRLVECLGRDRTRHQVAEVTSLGLVQMTRKKIGTGLAEAFTVPCETCKARGYHVHEAPVASQAPSDGGDRDNNHGRRRRGQHSEQSSSN